jgi:D-alanyl-D-alanine carboxypeptidase/D-alanyl-D-alanine-endopeptidase (penicillin-binding protein 4)
MRTTPYRPVGRQKPPDGASPSLLVLLGVIGAVLLFVAHVFVARAASEVVPVRSDPTPAGSVFAPIVSVRRIPSITSRSVRLGRLRASLAPVAAQVPPGSCLIVDAEGTRVVAVAPDAVVMPGSNLKLLVAATALSVLGPDHQFSTGLHGFLTDGVIQGNLWVVGGGDALLARDGFEERQIYPSTSPTRIEQIVGLLQTKGVTRITGSVVGDESRYDTERYTPSLGLGIKGTDSGPLGALLVNDGWVTGDEIKDENPAFAAAREITDVLEAGGIDVGGEPLVGAVPADVARVAELKSAPLTEYLTDMLTNSDNNSADLLLKEIGLRSGDGPTRTGGIAAVVRFLTEQNLPVGGLALVDGSGLDRGNRLPCNLVQAVLDEDGGFGSLGAGLAVAGQSGTLRRFFTETAAVGRLRGKTGTLTGVKALSGFLPYDERDALVFTLILNGEKVANEEVYGPIWNGLATALGLYTGSPTTEESDPLP